MGIKNKTHYLEKPIKRRTVLLAGGGVCLMISLSPGISWAVSKNTLKNVRTGKQPDDKTRIVLETSSKPDYEIYYLQNPNRIMIDLPNTNGISADKDLISGSLVSKFSIVQKDANGLRLIFTLKNPAMPVASENLFALNPSNGTGHRLVMDIKKTTEANFKRAVINNARATNKKTDTVFFSSATTAGTATQSVPQSNNNSTPSNSDKPIIVIDPGHGGKDPGCIGRGGTREKDVVLNVGKKLATQLRNSGKYRVYMTRDTDIFLNLDTRSGIAEKKHADLFISLHANANPSRQMRGFSVYTLSKKASDAEAEKLAEAENASDKIAFDGFEKYEPDIRSALGSLQQQMVAQTSVSFAEQVVKYNRGKAIIAQDKPRRFANFAVLRSSIPSVLFEIGHLSNATEEKLLTNATHHTKIINALIAAVDNFEFV